MPGIFLAVLAIALSPAGGGNQTASPSDVRTASQSEAAPATFVDWQREVQQALARLARATRDTVDAAIGRLVALQRQLAADQNLTLAQQRLLAGKLQRRLDRVPASVLAQFGAAPPAQPGGRTDVAAALSDLIQDTIDPESWDKNGGPGHISTFSR